MLEYIFHTVDIFVFDVHTTVSPLIGANYMREGMEFLANEELYKEQHRVRQTVHRDYFKIQSLTYNSKHHNHFWKNYLNVWHQQGRDYWRLQIPFVCETKDVKLNVIDIDGDVQISVKPTIYLCALGWSTNLTFRLTGNMNVEQVRSFIGKLRSKNEDDRIFELQEQLLNLSGVFKFFTGKLRETLYKPGTPVLDTTSVHRHIIVSLTNFSGPIYVYKKRWQGVGQRMTNAEQAELHSILRGEEIDVKTFAHLTIANKYSLVHYRGPDLALCYFDIGTLVFLQRSASKSGKKMAMHCLASNIRSCTMMTLIFLYFYAQAKKFDASHRLIKDMLEAIKRNLQQLPDKYTNQFCERLYDNHAELKKIRAVSSSADKADV